MTDRVGQVWQNITYFPFGEEWMQEGTNNSTIPYRFTGKEFDEETRLSYYGARYYDPRPSVWQSADPALGRFLSTDRSGGIEQPANFSLSAYVHQRPLVAIDPTGEACQAANGMISQSCLSARNGFWDRNPELGQALGDAIAPFNLYSNYQNSGLTNPLTGEVIRDTRRREDAWMGVVTLGVPASKAGPAMSAISQKFSQATSKVGSKLSKIFRLSVCSFDGSTLIFTKGGVKPNNEIQLNELVLSKNLESGRESWRQVKDRYLNTYDERVTVLLAPSGGGSDRLVSNKEHPVKEKTKGWIKFGELSPGDELHAAGGKWIAVKSVRVEKHKLEAYNLNVADDHTFFIGKPGVWVKNCDAARAAEIAKGLPASCKTHGQCNSLPQDY